MWSLLKRAAWSVPVAIAVTDRVATVVRVDGASMSPTFNPEVASSRFGGRAPPELRSL